VAEDKVKQLAGYAGILDIAGVKGDEKTTQLKGAAILLDLDWPSNYIDAPMCRRAVVGLIPRYEGYMSLLDYRKQWWAEDNKRKAEIQAC
jgi:hypothetical protein